ncbi:hypothetical protein K466DRAFT_404292 [Polyporus arcularius HHB13444]|uniref:Uncharacterized protein n=1 Tax=Polyporus arcularius HHB13444 TaxID=1314778 RepID=A0A5C3PKN0_9APHY|nr:hypothetical protein K466DRAFT_404292 [Polyporus arcularius HHB13444]
MHKHDVCKVMQRIMMIQVGCGCWYVAILCPLFSPSIWMALLSLQVALWPHFASLLTTRCSTVSVHPLQSHDNQCCRTLRGLGFRAT